MSEHKIIQRSLNRLENLFNKFPKIHIWSKYPDFPLSAKEYAIMVSYRENRTHKPYALANSIEVASVRQAYSLAAKKMEKHSSLQLYQRWSLLTKAASFGLIGRRFDASDIIHPVCTFIINSQQFENCLKDGKLDLSGVPLKPMTEYSMLSTANKKDIATRSIKLQLLVEIDILNE